jgi:hypothetical protein
MRKIRHNFYYDESEHSRKINKATIKADNYYDNFVTVCVGWRQEDEKAIEERYKLFEKMYEDRKSKDELKSTTLKFKDFKNGFASFNTQNAKLVEELLETFTKDVRFYFSVNSKIEYVINQMFCYYQGNALVNVESMKYSIIKTLLTYRPEDIINGIYDNSSEFVQLLKSFYKKRIEENNGNPALKYRENEAFAQIIIVLDNINENIKLDWNYSFAFEGFLKYIRELDLDEVYLTIDKEGESAKTLQAAKTMGITNAMEKDSKECIGIRMADMLAGIISKLLKAFHNALAYKGDTEYLRKKFLSEEWFCLTNEKFMLYKKLRYVIVELNAAEYKSYAGIYRDDYIVFLTFLDYINDFNSLEEFDSVEKKEHMEKFLSKACINLERYFSRFTPKLGGNISITPIVRGNEDYFQNKRGAKIYYDLSKQPILNFQEDEVIYEVLSVGFLGEMQIPSITVKEKETISCYKLPDELVGWVETCVSFSYIGMNLFPAKVKFTKRENEYYADIL